MTREERGVALLIRQKKRAAGKAYSITATTPTGRQTFTVTGWTGRKMFAVARPTGPRVEFSERDYFFAAADLALAGLPEPAEDWIIWLEGESIKFKVSKPTTGEPAVVFSDNQRMLFRIHTKLWVET